VATAGKILGTVLFYLPSGYGWREGLAVGSGMNGRGAVEIIIADIALRAGYISTEIFSILVFMAIFTTTTVPIFLGITTQWLKRRGELVMSDEKKKGILFLGAGPLARYLAQQFAKHQPVRMIDANKDHCRMANASGLECINGNGLKEEVLAEANAREMRSFVSLTGNSEINVLAAQVAHESFLIPHIHVLLSPTDEAAHVSLLKPIGGSTIFSRKIELDKWDHKIQHRNFAVYEYEVNAKVSPRKITKELITAEGEVLPVSYTDGNGNVSLFHYDAELEKGWKVQYLK
jgi:Trk K+ transport system NAD-binding subunit